MRNLEHSFIFCIICLLILFLLPMYMIYIERTAYIPHAEDQDYYVGKNYIHQQRGINPDFFKFDLGDGMISNIENIIISVSILWGIMRLIDLFRIMYDIDRRDRWLYFWHVIE